MKTLLSFVIVLCSTFCEGQVVQDKNLAPCDDHSPTFVNGTQVPCVNISLVPPTQSYMNSSDVEDWNKEMEDLQTANRTTLDIANCLRDSRTLDLRCPAIVKKLKSAVDDLCKRTKCQKDKK
jgi:hypothetical protein